jgi:hypothetical protein
MRVTKLEQKEYIGYFNVDIRIYNERMELVDSLVSRMNSTANDVSGPDKIWVYGLLAELRKYPKTADQAPGGFIAELDRTDMIRLNRINEQIQQAKKVSKSA